MRVDLEGGTDSVARGLDALMKSDTKCVDGYHGAGEDCGAFEIQSS